MYKRYYYSLMLMLLAISAQAQSSAPAMADEMRSNGKIYVVVAVMAVIFAAIVIYLVLIDRKISSLEKKINK